MSNNFKPVEDWEEVWENCNTVNVGEKEYRDHSSLCMIMKEAIHVDKRYQRNTVSMKKINNIVNNWDWRIFGALTLAQRSQDLYLIDGGHRWRAAMIRADIKVLPAKVYDFEQLKEEASAFVGINTTSTNVRPTDIHKAKVTANDEIAVQTEKIVDEFGYTISEEKGNKFKAVNALNDCVSRDYDMAEQVFGLCSQISKNGHIPGYLVKAIFFIAENSNQNIFQNPWRKKLIDCGLEIVDAEVKRSRALTCQGGYKAAAYAIIGLLNKGRRVNKVHINGGSE